MLESAADYFPEEREICATDAGLRDSLRVTWVLKPKPSAPPEEASAETVAASSLLTGYLVDELTGLPVNNASVRLQSEDCEDELSTSTDQDGQFSFAWEDACCYELTASKEGYFAQRHTETVCAAGEGDQQEVRLQMAPYRLEQDQALSQQALEGLRVFKVGSQTYEDESGAIPYLLNIYYDLGRASVRPEAIPELNKLLGLMVDNQAIILEVSSHTDSQGPASYNERLSQRRANAIVNWLVHKGIDRDRLVGKGYGESRLINDCADGIQCDDDEHQMNRRTEFRVLGERLGQN